MLKTFIQMVFMASLALAFQAQAAKFEVSSPDIAANKKISNKHVFAGFGCSGENISPALEWRNLPAGTKSIAITAYDPDAPTGSGWWHWVVFNMPADTTRLAVNAGSPAANLLPAGSVQSMTDFGQPGYGGPCPPQGHKPHRYQFTVWALKEDKLPLDAKAPGAMVGYFLNQNVIGKTTLTGLYGR